MHCLTLILAPVALLATLVGGCAEDDATPRPSPKDAAGAVVAAAPTPDAGQVQDQAAARPTDLRPPISAETPRCGQPPFTIVRLHARNAVPSAAGQAPVPNTSITLKHCPGLSLATNAQGQALLALSVGAETWVRFQAPGFIPFLLGEVSITEHVSERDEVTATLVPIEAQPILLPMYKSDRPLIYVHVQMGRADAPQACRSRDGVTIVVKDQPGATVLYRKGPNASPIYAAGEGTSLDGIAIVTGIAPTTSSVTVTASKAGCPYVISYGDANAAELIAVNQTPVQAGAVTFVAANPKR